MWTFSRQASTISARRNNSIISISDLGTPNLTPLNDIAALHLALGWLLNYTAAGLPPMSSLAYTFWNDDPGLSDHDWEVGAYTTLKNILAFTSWFFAENNYGNPDIDPSNQTAVGFPFLSKEFHTTASMARQRTKFNIDSRMFVAYIVLQMIMLLFCWAVLIWRIRRGSPRLETSSFPLLDFLFKADSKEVMDIDVEDLRFASDSLYLEKLRDVEVVACSSNDE